MIVLWWLMKQRGIGSIEKPSVLYGFFWSQNLELGRIEVFICIENEETGTE